MTNDVNTYVMAAAATIDCHECHCHIAPPCNGCVDCKVCNPCGTCDGFHDGPRDDECTRKAAQMTELTPERIHDAAVVVRALSVPPHVLTGGEHDYMMRAALHLENIAERCEREQAEEAKREKRIEQLANEIWLFAGGATPLDLITQPSRQIYIDTARKLLDRYPTLAEAPNCGHPNHGNYDDHDCAPTLDYQARSGR